jgi:hypothetical protein
VETTPLSLANDDPPIVIVPLRRLDRIARKGLRFAVSISNQVEALLIVTNDAMADEQCATSLAACWETLVNAPLAAECLHPVKLVTLPSDYREFITPLLNHVRGVAAANPGRFVAVVVPEVVEQRWYDVIFASHRPALVKAALRSQGGPQVLVVDAPWHIGDPDVVPGPPQPDTPKSSA